MYSYDSRHRLPMGGLILEKWKSVLFPCTFCFAGSIAVMHFSPQQDWYTVFLYAAVSLMTGALFYLYLAGRERILKEDVDRLIALLHSIDAREEALSFQETPLGGLRDEILKSLVEKREDRDQAVKARGTLKRNMEDITHQIKTPLTGILLLLDLLAEDETNREEYLRMIRKEMERLHGLSDLLLKLSSFDAGTVVMSMQEFSVRELFADAELIVETQLRQGGVRLVYGDEDMMLCADRTWILEALINLIKNAIDASEPGEEIELNLHETVIYKSILVRDTGPGIPVEHREKLFERFHKLNPKSEGFGIGLAMARSIMDEHGGLIRVQSDRLGSEFELRFLNY